MGAQAPADVPTKPEKKSAAVQLIELARTCYDLGITTDEKPFGLRKGGHVVRFLKGGSISLRQELGALYHRTTGKVASETALTEAIGVLHMTAVEQDPVEAALRSARGADGALYIDLGDRDEHVIRVTPTGWDVLDANAPVPVIFRRTKLTQALPMPERGGDLEQIWSFVNVSEQDRAVIRGWLVAAHVLVGLPCALLALLGEQGTAKTSGMRRMLALVDPSAAPARRAPKDADNLLHAMQSSRATGFDNLSSIPRWMSDGLCIGVTGAADVDRSLYTDDDVRVIRVQGVLAFTSIDVGNLAGDLAERCVWGELEVIPAAKRKSERTLNAEWAEAYPAMLGGLLDLIVLTLAQLPAVQLPELPRMADFAEVLAAMDLATGSDSLARYTRAHDSVAAEIVETDDFLVALTRTITKRWEGTGKELYELLPAPEDKTYWPKPRGISGHLRRRAGELRKVGWTVEEVKPADGSNRAKTLVLCPPAPQVSDADLSSVAVMQDVVLRDRQDWIDRVIADGATPRCAVGHAEYFQAGATMACAEAACTVRQDTPGYSRHGWRSQQLAQRLHDELRRLGLTLPEFERLRDERGVLAPAPSSPAPSSPAPSAPAAGSVASIEDLEARVAELEKVPLADDGSVPLALRLARLELENAKLQRSMPPAIEEA